jgi:hypothetical protein
VVVVTREPGADTAHVMSSALPMQEPETMVGAFIGAARAIDSGVADKVLASTREGDPPTGHA